MNRLEDKYPVTQNIRLHKTAGYTKQLVTQNGYISRDFNLYIERLSESNT